MVRGDVALVQHVIRLGVVKEIVRFDVGFLDGDVCALGTNVGKTIDLRVFQVGDLFCELFLVSWGLQLVEILICPRVLVVRVVIASSSLLDVFIEDLDRFDVPQRRPRLLDLGGLFVPAELAQSFDAYEFDRSPHLLSERVNLQSLDQPQSLLGFLEISERT